MNKIYSFYYKKNREVIKETLDEHISKALNVINNLIKSPISKYMHKIGLNDPLKFFNMAKLSIIFHDVGKIFYQHDPFEIQEYINFSGHEFFSTYIYKEFHKYCYKLYTREFKNNMEIPIEFSIFYHHHAMDINKRKELLKEKNININKGIDLLNSLTETLSPFLKKEISFKDFKIFINNLEEKIEKNRNNLIASIRMEVEEVEKQIWETIISDNKIKKISYILLTVLLVADNIAAQEKRSHLTDVYHIALNDFYNLYLQG
jgi:CRISPR/Cas system-associated endonuclease Cas3-HD